MYDHSTFILLINISFSRIHGWNHTINDINCYFDVVKYVLTSTLALSLKVIRTKIRVSLELSFVCASFHLASRPGVKYLIPEAKLKEVTILLWSFQCFIFSYEDFCPAFFFRVAGSLALEPSLVRARARAFDSNVGKFYPHPKALGSLSKSLRLVLLRLPWLKRSGESTSRWYDKY